MGSRVVVAFLACLVTVSIFLLVLRQQPVPATSHAIQSVKESGELQELIAFAHEHYNISSIRALLQAIALTNNQAATITNTQTTTTTTTTTATTTTTSTTTPTTTTIANSELDSELVCYKNRYEDLKSLSDSDALKHFVLNGCKEGRHMCTMPSRTENEKGAKGIYTPENAKLLRDHEQSVEESGELQKLIAYAHEHYNISSMRSFFQKHGYLVFRPRIPVKTFESAVDFTDRLDKGDMQRGNFTRGHYCTEGMKGGPCIQDRYDNPGSLGLATDWSTRAVIAALYNKNPYSFQSLNYPRSSQAFTHSDYIHFGTYPPEGMCAVWFALEDINPNAGPLFYYPESQKMPYANMRSFGLGTVSSGDYPHYQTRIEAMAEQMGFKRQTFTPRRGEALLWNGNLLHGGPPPVDRSLTRLSMVVHFYFYGNVYGWHPVSSNIEDDHVAYVNQVRVHQIWGRIPADGPVQNKQIADTCNAVVPSPCKQSALSLGLKIDEQEGSRRCRSGHGYIGVNC